MTELNVTSPIGIRELEHASDIPSLARLGFYLRELRAYVAVSF
jgi:hypothetical protein